MLLTQSKLNPEIRIEQPLISWEQFKLIQHGFADSKGIRLAYYEGILEIVSTSVDHELIKTIIGALLEAIASITNPQLANFFLIST